MVLLITAVTGLGGLRGFLIPMVVIVAARAAGTNNDDEFASDQLSYWWSIGDSNS